MKFTVYQEGVAVGTATITSQKRSVTFDISCDLDTADVLRCFGVTADPAAPLRIGVMEPKEGKLLLHRNLSYQSLAATGCEEQLPSEYYLSPHADGQQPYEIQNIGTGSEGEPASPENPILASSLLESNPEKTDALPSAEILCDAESDPITPITKEALPITGDILLDSVIASGTVTATSAPDHTLRLQCPFDPLIPFPMAFAFSCCRLEKQNNDYFFVMDTDTIP